MKFKHTGTYENIREKEEIHDIQEGGTLETVGGSRKFGKKWTFEKFGGTRKSLNFMKSNKNVTLENDDGSRKFRKRLDIRKFRPQWGSGFCRIQKIKIEKHVEI